MSPPSDFRALLAELTAQGEAPALSFYRGATLVGRLSHAELGARASALAVLLARDFGLEKGDRVAILSPNRLEIPVLMLALLRLGAIAVPLNPTSGSEDWAYVLEHSGARMLCVADELAGRVANSASPLAVLHVEQLFALAQAVDDAETLLVAVPAALSDIDLSEALAVILYTSGTTGNPKGVALRQRNLLANAWSMAQNFALQRTTQMTVLPLYHAHAFGFGLMTALATGGHLVFTERLEPFTWAAVIRRESVAVTSAVPSLLPMLLAAGVTQEKVPSLRALLVSSAPLSTIAARQFEARTQIPLVQGWGLSEYTNFACCLSPALSAEEHAQLLFSEEVPSIGPALEGTEVRVLTPAGSLAAEGERGELAIRGHSTMSGYYRDPDTTAHAIDADGWLRTGDEGFFRLHGNRPVFFVTGRLKEIIIRDAEKYSPLRLERGVLAALPELTGSFVIVGFPHRDHGEEIGAYLQRETLEEPLGERLRAAIAALPVAERPKVLLHGTHPIPRTHTGKIQRRKMQPWFSAWATHRGPLVVAELKTT